MTRLWRSHSALLGFRLYSLNLRLIHMLSMTRMQTRVLFLFLLLNLLRFHRCLLDFLHLLVCLLDLAWYLVNLELHVLGRETSQQQQRQNNYVFHGIIMIEEEKPKTSFAATALKRVK